MLQTIQMKLVLLCVWAELAVLGSGKTALKFKYNLDRRTHIQFYVQGDSKVLERWVWHLNQ